MLFASPHPRTANALVTSTKDPEVHTPRYYTTHATHTTYFIPQKMTTLWLHSTLDLLAAEVTTRVCGLLHAASALTKAAGSIVWATLGGLCEV